MQASGASTPSLTDALGLRWPGFAGVAGPSALTLTLFACPLVYKLATEWEDVVGALRAWVHRFTAATNSVLASACELFADEHLPLWRNLVIAPASEEWVFRACMAPLLRAAVGPAARRQAWLWAGQAGVAMLPMRSFIMLWAGFQSRPPAMSFHEELTGRASCSTRLRASHLSMCPCFSS